MHRRLGTIVLVFLTSTALRAGENTPAAEKGDSRAAALLAQAAQSRYTWTSEVRTVSGKFTWTADGKSGSGTFDVTLHQRDGYHFNATGGGEIPAEVQEHIESMISHRTPPPPNRAQRSAAPAVIVVEDDAQGPLIMMLGDRFQSTQRVKDHKLVQVNRRMSGKRFTIDVTRFENAGHDKVYPADFTVTWWNAKTGKRLEKQFYTTEGLERIDGQLFPRAEKVVSEKLGKTSTMAIRYSDVHFQLVLSAVR